jgi:hypothetical protein
MDMFQKAMTSLREKIQARRDFYADYVGNLRAGAYVGHRQRVIEVCDELLAVVDRELAAIPSRPSRSAPDP